MGYTHYYTTVQVKGRAKQNEAAYQKAIMQCNKVIKGYNKAIKEIDPKHPDRLSGFSAYAKGYGGLNVNGTEELSHEDFIMREHFNQNESEFCKTNQKPYDVIVVACLIILKHYLKVAIQVASDGDRSDWIDGLDLAIKFTGLKSLKIPHTITSRLKIVS
jgi:hypothetical protein